MAHGKCLGRRRRGGCSLSSGRPSTSFVDRNRIKLSRVFLCFAEASVLQLQSLRLLFDVKPFCSPILFPLSFLQHVHSLPLSFAANDRRWYDAGATKRHPQFSPNLSNLLLFASFEFRLSTIFSEPPTPSRLKSTPRRCLLCVGLSFFISASRVRGRHVGMSKKTTKKRHDRWFHPSSLSMVFFPYTSVCISTYIFF